MLLEFAYATYTRTYFLGATLKLRTPTNNMSISRGAGHVSKQLSCLTERNPIRVQFYDCCVYKHWVDKCVPHHHHILVITQSRAKYTYYIHTTTKAIGILSGLGLHAFILQFYLKLTARMTWPSRSTKEYNHLHISFWYSKQ